MGAVVISDALHELWERIGVQNVGEALPCTLHMVNNRPSNINAACSHQHVCSNLCAPVQCAAAISGQHMLQGNIDGFAAA